MILQNAGFQLVEKNDIDKALIEHNGVPLVKPITMYKSFLIKPFGSFKKQQMLRCISLKDNKYF